MSDQGRRLRSAKSIVTLIVALAGLILGLVSVVHPSSARGFVARSGDKLMLSDRVFRFSGANISWGGLDENGRTSLNYPTPFRVTAALATVADMGGTVVRCQSCGISTGNPYSVEPSLGMFNQTALQHIDYFIAEAQKYGIRLDIPLTGNYQYYVGGYHNFTDWLGLSSPSNCPSAACASIFYTNPRAISAFEKYISVLLNHVNVYTGVPNKDNPTIMSWETGNEMPYGTGGPAEFTRWTNTISVFIKSIAPHQLVMDGALITDPGDLKLPDVDIQSPHFYPINIGRLNYLASRVAAARQALVIGEYGWNNPSVTAGLVPFLSDIQHTASISGDIYWDLLPQNDDFGFTEHYDGYQLHFPGDNADIAPGAIAPVRAPVSDAPLVTDLRRHAYAMSGLPVPSYAVPAAPVITNVEHVASTTAGYGNLVEWRGSAGAARYVVRRSMNGPDGPWTTVGDVNAAATEEPYLDPGAGAGPSLWYEVTAVNPDGVAGENSAAFQLRGRTLDDNLKDFSQSYSHSNGVAIDTQNPGLYNGDWSRAQFSVGGGNEDIVWRVTALQSFEALGYYSKTSVGEFRFMLSTNGFDWTPVPGADVQANEEAVAAINDWAPFIYTIDNIQQILPGAEYVMVRWDSNVPCFAELGEVRITYP